MTEISQIYKCDVCGNIVEMVHAGAGQLVCCGQPMAKQNENTTDAAQEKHIPVVEKTENGVKIKVGSIPHPMEEAHQVEWIEVLAGGKTCRKFLKAGDAPETEFNIPAAEITSVREYCNIHGLWKK
jgi:superoxide reductase